jgi:hypothetical protein
MTGKCGCIHPYAPELFNPCAPCFRPARSPAQQLRYKLPAPFDREVRPTQSAPHDAPSATQPRGAGTRCND